MQRRIGTISRGLRGPIVKEGDDLRKIVVDTFIDCVNNGEFEIGRIGERKVSWKQQAGRASIDSKKLKEEHPMIYAKYLKTGKPYRVLRIS